MSKNMNTTKAKQIIIIVHICIWILESCFTLKKTTIDFIKLETECE